jgi:Flp pilus assembly protein TadG
MDRLRTTVRAKLTDRSGSAAVEFAILGPILILLLIGILVYGGYFLMAHSVQQLANDAARSAVAGLSDTERQQLAAGTLANELPSYGFLQPSQVQLGYSDRSQVMTVNISYDASASPLWALNGVIPMPPSTIVRSASVQVGGF